MYKLVLALALALTVSTFSGCGEEEAPPPPETAAPAPPTPAEIESALMKAVQPVISSYESGAPLGPEQMQPNISALQTALGAHRANPNHVEAFRTVGSRLKDYARQAHRSQKAGYVVYCFDALKMVDAPSAEDIKRLREEAQLIIDMPKATVTGFMTDENNGQTTIFLSVYLPQTGKTESKQVRVGDELFNLRVVEIKGDNRCVVFEYLINNELFEVCTKSARESL